MLASDEGRAGAAATEEFGDVAWRGGVKRIPPLWATRYCRFGSR